MEKNRLIVSDRERQANGSAEGKRLGRPDDLVHLTALLV